MSGFVVDLRGSGFVVARPKVRFLCRKCTTSGFYVADFALHRNLTFGRSTTKPDPLTSTTKPDVQDVLQRNLTFKTFYNET